MNPAARALRPPAATPVSVALAVAIVAAWLGLHVHAVWFLDAPAHPVRAALCLIGLTWLSVGLFIVAHDAMHGAILPGRPRLNAAIGRLALTLYAGFSWPKLMRHHMAHHRAPGSADDPDFGHGHRGIVAWYADFVRTYFGWREVFVLGGAVILYALILGPRWPYVAFWAVPSLMASVQLFVFGTFLPHRLEAGPFADRHNAASTRLAVPLSLLTCYHFGGYHHEHHLHPGVPWWALPRTRTGPRR
ncbi:fatty acid desaturase [Paracoccus sanguinis]|uniref:Beta-carotene ketolase (CrtW type) n=1 Tax=Paracoccus sanguinis TaxID=1545044 RepID=A0A1H3AMV2_9RHOB|nr:fatty acid desaturase [Paracoccus sanguinis]SDX30761.1 beta-carotene ketolase (CrtW type) [Paracoccus sanguinis]